MIAVINNKVVKLMLLVVILLTVVSCSEESKTTTNHVPVIENFKVNSNFIEQSFSAQPNIENKLRVAVSDADNDDLTVQWSAEKGTLSSNKGREITYHAPDKVVEDKIEVIVSDGKASTKGNLKAFIKNTEQEFLITGVKVDDRIVEEKFAAAAKQQYQLELQGEQMTTDELEIAWYAEQGSFISNQGTQVQYIAPQAEGTDNIQVVVTGENSKTKNNLAVTVQSETEQFPEIKDFKVNSQLVEGEFAAEVGTEYDLSAVVDNLKAEAEDITWQAEQGRFLSNNQLEVTYVAPEKEVTEEIKLSIDTGQTKISDTFTVATQVKDSNLTQVQLDFAIPDTSLPNLNQAQVEQLTTQTTKETEVKYIDDELILQFKSEIKSEEINSFLQKYNLTITNNITDEIKTVKINDGPDARELYEKLRGKEIIAGIDLNYFQRKKTSDNSSSEYSDLKPDGSNLWHNLASNLLAVWEHYPIDDLEKNTVAVIDSGVDLDHPLLEDDLVAEKNISNPDESADDSEGHGTHVAGLIAADYNAQNGVRGVNPKAKIMPVKTRTSIEDLIEGIIYAVDNGADVINLSISVPYLPYQETEEEYISRMENSPLKEAVETAYQQGVIVVASAGNSGGYTSDYVDNFIEYPARYDSVISVGAINSELELTSFSDYSEKLDFVAPGKNILSTVPDGYEVKQGTSMSAPIFAGLVSLLKSKHPNFAPKRAKEFLKNYSKDLRVSNLENEEYNYRLVDAYRMVNEVDFSDIKVFVGQEEVTDTAIKIDRLSEMINDAEQDYINVPVPQDDSYNIYAWVDVDGNGEINKGDYFSKTQDDKLDLKVYEGDKKVTLN